MIGNRYTCLWVDGWVNGWIDGRREKDDRWVGKWMEG